MDVDGENMWVKAEIKWSCQGWVVDGDDQVQIMEFYPTIEHHLNVRVSSSSLSVYNNQLVLKDITFDDVEDLHVINGEVFSTLMSETYNDMRTYVIGTWFKVKDGSTSVLYSGENYKGVWIG